MDAETAASVIDDAFQALGTPDCTYTPPGGGAPMEGVTVIVHRRSSERTRGAVRFDRGGFDTDVRTVAVIVRSTEVAEPVKGGRFLVGGAAYVIGEEPTEEDVHGVAWRCACEKVDA